MSAVKMEVEGSPWGRWPEAQAFVDRQLGSLVGGFPPAAALAKDLRDSTDTRLADWIDHFVLAGGDDSLPSRLASLGFERAEVPTAAGEEAWVHPGAAVPPILLRTEASAAPGTLVAAAVGVEDAARFLMARRMAAGIEGTIRSPYRRSVAWRSKDGSRELAVVERRGYRGFIPVEEPIDAARRHLEGLEAWETRRRNGVDPEEAMSLAEKLARGLVSSLGTATASWVVLEAERAYWQRRNRAATVQGARQEALGMGWANHDHHTFRSCRRCFTRLVALLAMLGFRARERYFAGAQAGWGAQIMEQPESGLTVFADVDLSADEVAVDFASRELPARRELGTVGLWCALHGDSILAAGLHHLAVRMDFRAAPHGLAGWGVGVLPPFSDFPHLRQAFTQGQQWDVRPAQLERLQERGRIGAGQAERFAAVGAIGSHLELIERGDGFKGFNQRSVSEIIRRTDPRGGEPGAA